MEIILIKYPNNQIVGTYMNNIIPHKGDIIDLSDAKHKDSFVAGTIKINYKMNTVLVYDEQYKF